MKNLTENPYYDEVASLYAPAKGYVVGVVELMLRHLWQLSKKEGCSIADQFSNIGWLARLLTIDKRARDPVTEAEVQHWVGIRNRLIEILDSCENLEYLDESVSQCMSVVMPILEERFVEGYRFEKRDFGCWWYTIHEGETVVAVHLINAFMPDSPFKDIVGFSGDMIKAIENARYRYPQVKLVECGSWLNQIAQFQELWPESFKSNQIVLNETGGFGPGVWGQYMTADGGVNASRATHLLEKGKHPYVLTEARCDVNDVIEHLKNLIERLKDNL